jgi:hypothetical protein
MTRTSHQDYLATPSAVLSGIPLWAVTSMKLTESYKLPPIGSTTWRAIVDTHDDTIDLNGILVGPERYAWKVALERFAEVSRLGAPLPIVGTIKGLVLVTALAIRTDLQIQSLTFSVTAERRDVIDVAISLVHLPRPGAWGQRLLGAAGSVGIAALADWRVGGLR